MARSMRAIKKASDYPAYRKRAEKKSVLSPGMSSLRLSPSGSLTLRALGENRSLVWEGEKITRIGATPKRVESGGTLGSHMTTATL